MIKKYVFVSITFVALMMLASLSSAQNADPVVEATPQLIPQALVPTPPTAPPSTSATSPVSSAPAPAEQQLPAAPPSQRPEFNNAPPATPPSPTAYSYYCDRTKAYFPTVAECPDGWVAVPVTVPPAMAEQPLAPQPVAQPMYQPVPVWHPWINRVSDSVNARTNAISLELFGRANYYSFNYDHALSDRWALGTGISNWSQSYYWSQYNTNVTIVPLYANYYFSQYRDRGYLTFGAEYIQGSQPANPNYNNNIYLSDSVAGVVGLGYEFRYDGGFLFRVSAYVVGNQNTVNFNPGVSFGYTF